MQTLFNDDLKAITDWLKTLGLQTFDISPNKDWGYVVNVVGSVNLFDCHLTRLPVKFGIVTGNFNVGSNDMENLIGCPDYVGGNFYCAGSQLQSLEGAPRKVVGDWDSQYNHLTSLKGGPTEVGGHYDCSSCSLTSLEGSPEVIGLVFQASHNNLSNLIGGPKKVGSTYLCGESSLKNLEGAPEEVGGDFNCAINDLDNLNFLPGVVNGSFTSFGNPKLGEAQKITDVRELHTILEIKNLKNYLNEAIINPMAEISEEDKSLKAESIFKL